MKKITNEIDDQMLDELIQQALSNNLLVKIPDDFADRMEMKAKKINHFRYWREELFKQLLVVGGIVVMILALFSLLFYFKIWSIDHLFDLLNQRVFLVIFSVVALVTLVLLNTWIEKKLNYKES